MCVWWWDVTKRARQVICGYANASFSHSRLTMIRKNVHGALLRWMNVVMSKYGDAPIKGVFPQSEVILI